MELWVSMRPRESTEIPAETAVVRAACPGGTRVTRLRDVLGPAREHRQGQAEWHGEEEEAGDQAGGSPPEATFADFGGVDEQQDGEDEFRGVLDGFGVEGEGDGVAVEESDDDAGEHHDQGAPRFHRSSREEASERTANARAMASRSEFMVRRSSSGCGFAGRRW